MHSVKPKSLSVILKRNINVREMIEASHMIPCIKLLILRDNKNFVDRSWLKLIFLNVTNVIIIRYNQFLYVNICERVKINRISRNKIQDVLNHNIE